jgi:hypothetical protein
LKKPKKEKKGGVTLSTKISFALSVLILFVLTACGGKATEEMIPVGQHPAVGQPQPTGCFAREYHQDELGPTNQVTIVPIRDGWLVATADGLDKPTEITTLARMGGVISTNALTEVNAGIGQLAVSGATYLVTGYSHKEGERPEPIVLTRKAATGMEQSTTRWWPGKIAPYGAGFVYADTDVEGGGSAVYRTELGIIEPGGKTEKIATIPHPGAHCAISGGVVSDRDRNIAAMVIAGDTTSHEYKILIATYSASTRGWSQSTVGSFSAPGLSTDNCHPELVIRPLGIFTDVSGEWRAVWASPDGVTHLAWSNSLGQWWKSDLDLPFGATVLAATQVPGGYLLAVNDRQQTTIAAAFVQLYGQIAAYQRLVYGQMLMPSAELLPGMAGTAALAATTDGRTAALAYVAKGGRASALIFSNDCQ